MRLSPPPGVVIVRNFQRFDGQARADHAASHRLGFRQRQRIGEFFYTASNIDGRAFPTRKAAVIASTHSQEPKQ